jgi:hypothetical protein
MPDEPAVLTYPASGFFCHGNWLIGSACGKCPRCAETAKPAIEGLRKELADTERRLFAVLALVPRSSSGRDLSDRDKARLFDEVRREIYGETMK